ncbi:cGMP-dependent 3',5'-cyclic phosphodiesterase [Schistosoma japonicum]|uniref:cGMP-dependent 3',5'-cyclic phosphodiesterase n=1 Tax=Schistosoma japonicum TaxID=6182 RepID=A0A4Z2D898_SCHJA|nr:cGMP-dependent 3',5'-cyclic phosphodiesterase [Schistosoma japonicum]
MPEIIQMTNEVYNPCNLRHHELLLSILVTVCDLNDQYKNWYNTHDTAKLIYHEFFNQGDLEKVYGITPLSSLDRHKKHLYQNYKYIFLIQLYNHVSISIDGEDDDLNDNHEDLKDDDDDDDLDVDDVDYDNDV